ncbi:MAG TPA: hypothetical protein VK815_01110, partial [Candidatus Acidoferrales bacterium]|nr:hypothetical protein [Candidatus Acidoferrales bacterium]
LARSRGALWVAFKRKLQALHAAGGNLEAVEDGRAENGDRVDLPETDITKLTHSAVINDGRINAAWRECYPKLSQDTRRRYPPSFKAPEKIREILPREKIDALKARHHGKRTLRRKVGGVRRDWTGIPSMHSWVVDDLTANLQVVLTDDAGNITKDTNSEPYLFTPQVIAVMDSASRKFVGWTPSTAKAPNAGIVCDSVMDGMKIHGVPSRLGVENGFVFGKSLLVNGKEDDDGRTLVAGLGQFGCEVDHFEKMNPQSKSELEFGFEQIQRLMERHPGYTGRLQMIDAPEEFKKEERLIRTGWFGKTRTRALN